MRIVMAAVLVVWTLNGCSEGGQAGTNQGMSAFSGGAAPTNHQPPRAKASDGPFGIDFGAAVDSVPGLGPVEGQPNLYRTSSPPKAHPHFEEVVIEAYPGVGICLIRGVGRNISGDAAGASIRGRVDSLAEALETKYGKASKSDVCNGGDVACEQQFWMMTMNDGERWYGYSWEKPNEVMKRNHIRELHLAARASDINTSYPVIEFLSDDKTKCEAASKKEATSAL